MKPNPPLNRTAAVESLSGLADCVRRCRLVWRSALKAVVHTTALAMILSLFSVVSGVSAELPLITGETYRGVVFPTNMAWPGQFDGFWLPSTNDIAQAELAIARFLATASTNSTVDRY